MLVEREQELLVSSSRMASSVIPSSDAGRSRTKQADDHPSGKSPNNGSDMTSKTATPVKAALPKSGPAKQAPQDAAAIAVHNAEQDSIEAALPILPRGFVGNTAEIYAEVASFDVIPPEKLREYWRGMSLLRPWHCPPEYEN